MLAEIGAHGSLIMFVVLDLLGGQLRLLEKRGSALWDPKDL